jgi:hypothetical protein
MMMKMLEAGGIPVLTDHIRTADEDNPKGYYEFERAKELEHDTAWLPDAQGKVVKLIAALLKHLPSVYEYHVVFMERDIEETLASQRQMLIHRGEPTDSVSDERMTMLFAKHVEQVKSWIESQANIQALYVHYGDVLAAPESEVSRIDSFLGGELDTARMIRVVDPELYRQRG